MWDEKAYYAAYYLKNKERIRVRTRKYYLRTRAKRLQRAKVWRDDNVECANSGKYAYIARNPEKRKAHTAVSNALSLGKILRQPCSVCGVSKLVHAHHDDYAKPLEVVWLCQKHHIERHQRVSGTADVPGTSVSL